VGVGNRILLKSWQEVQLGLLHQNKNGVLEDNVKGQLVIKAVLLTIVQ
jgi:hypothetical protein